MMTTGYAYAHAHTYTRARAYIHTHQNIHTCMHQNDSTDAHACKLAHYSSTRTHRSTLSNRRHTHAHTHTCTQTPNILHTHTCAHKSMQTHTHAHVHIYTHRRSKRVGVVTCCSLTVVDRHNVHVCVRFASCASVAIFW